MRKGLQNNLKLIDIDIVMDMDMDMDIFKCGVMVAEAFPSLRQNDCFTA